MLTRLRDALADPEHGAAAAGDCGNGYRVVMVDEFQDTDPVQWEILRRAFHGAATLILIGDPKQAIYAFRGADVYSYLDAVGQADQVCTLGDQLAQRPGPGGCPGVLDGRRDARRRRDRGPPGGGRPSAAAADLDRRSGRRVDRAGPDPAAGDPAPAGCRDRAQRRPVCGRGSSPTWWPTSPPCWPAMHRWTTGAGPEPVQPADLAVLVRTNERGEADPGCPGRRRGARRDARRQFGVRLADGPGLADPADRPRAAPAAGGPAGRADLLLRLDLRPAGRGERARRTGAGRPHPAGPLVGPAAGRPRGRGPAGGGDRRRRRARATAGDPRG